MEGFIMESRDINDYLMETEVIDHHKNEIREIAAILFVKGETRLDFIENAYHFVRDQIYHTADIGGTVVTCRASEVLKKREGVCYAKSHLLAAILRQKGIPCGFCYQGLQSDAGQDRKLFLHGLNAVYLEWMDKWVRLDARGNKQGMNAEFSIDEEKLAYTVDPGKGEYDFRKIFARPAESVLRALRLYTTFEELYRHLPDSLQ